MRHCNGRLFDGSACNNPTLDCPTCQTSGCLGDGCESQLATSQTCDECGSSLTGTRIAA